MDKLRVHIQQSENSLDAFRLSESRLSAMLQTHSDVTDGVVFSFGDERASLDRGLIDAEVVVAGNFDAVDLRNRAPRLKWVQSILAGVEKLVPLIPDDVVLTNASGVHSSKAGEYAVCALLMLNSAVPKFVELQRSRRWKPIFTRSLSGKTVLILGIGKIGSAAAARAKQFDMRVLGVSRGGAPQSPFDRIYPVDRLHEGLPEADFLINALPETAETRKLIGVREFAAMPAGAGFVSIGRGSTTDETALVESLRSNHLRGAVLDVFEQEPLPLDSPLWSLNGVIISAHCAIDDVDTYLQSAVDIFVNNVRRYLKGLALENIVDLKRGY